MPEVQSALRKQNANAESCQLLIARGHDDIYDIVCQMRGHPLANKLPPKQKTQKAHQDLVNTRNWSFIAGLAGR